MTVTKTRRDAAGLASATSGPDRVRPGRHRLRRSPAPPGSTVVALTPTDIDDARRRSTACSTSSRRSRSRPTTSSAASGTKYVVGSASLVAGQSDPCSPAVHEPDDDTDDARGRAPRRPTSSRSGSQRRRRRSGRPSPSRSRMPQRTQHTDRGDRRRASPRRASPRPTGASIVPNAALTDELFDDAEHRRPRRPGRPLRAGDRVVRPGRDRRADRRR